MVVFMGKTWQLDLNLIINEFSLYTFEFWFTDYIHHI